MAKAWENLPIEIKEALLSDEYTGLLESLKASLNLNEAQANVVEETSDDVLWGDVSRSDFPNILRQKLPKLNENALNQIASQLNDKVFSAIAPFIVSGTAPNADVQETQTPPPTPAAANIPPAADTPQPVAAPPAPIPPTPEPAAQAPASTPYILHQEAAFKTLSEEHNINYEPIKRAFFSSSQPSTPTFKEPTGPAKIQFSGQKPETPAAPRKPEAARTEAFIPKIVHYSTLMTPLSPFGNSREPINPQPAIAPEPPAPAAPPAAISEPKVPQTKFNDEIIEEVAKSAASPENKKIDLKDLPL